MATLEAILAQISQSADSLKSISFGPPQLFVNALLQPHDITTLIRDTEAHERALFTVSQPPPPPRAVDPSAKTRRRTIVAEQRPPQYIPPGGGGGGGYDTSRLPPPRRNTAVAAVLGGDLMQRIRREERCMRSGAAVDSKEGGDVDVEILLEGAEKLCRVYPIPGAIERINEMRARYSHLSHSINRLEHQCAQQSAQLAALGRVDDDLDRQVASSHQSTEQPGTEEIEAAAFTSEDVRREEALIRELEHKKAALEEQIRRGQEAWA